MDFRKILIFIIPVILLQCSLFSIKNNDYYSKGELSILEKTLDILDYGYGYDDDVELNYIYAYSYSNSNIDKKEKRFAKAINKIDIDILIPFYEKILRLYLITDHKMNEYKKDSEWKDYNFIKNDIYQPLERYLTLLQRYLLKREPSLKTAIDKRRDAIQKEIEK